MWINEGTKKDKIEKCISAVLNPSTERNRMGCSENWYDEYYAVGATFSEDKLNRMSETEINNLLKLAGEIGDALY